MRYHPHMPTRRRHRNCLVLCALLCSVPAFAHAAFWDEKKSYHLDITTPEGTDKELEKQLENIRNLLEDAPAGSSTDTAYLRYRFDQNKTYLQKALEAQGYYQAKITANFDEEKSTAHFLVTPGPRYPFGEVTLKTSDPFASSRPPINFPALANLKTKPRQPAIAPTVLEDEETIKSYLSEHNCLFSYDVSHQAVLDTVKKEVAVAFQASAGADATFGALHFEGNDTIAPDYLARVLPMKKGDCFRREKINDARVALQKTGLLATIEPEVAASPAPDGSVPVTFRLKERAPRTIKFGTSYSTDIGPGVTAGWEHRNIFSRGEKLGITASLTPIQRTLETTFDKPFFLRDDQKLKLSTKLDQQDTDAYTSTGLTAEAGVERDFKDGLRAGIGAKYGFTQIKDQTSTQNVALLSAPAFIAKDKRNDPLDATRGWLLRLDTTPYIDTIDPTVVFYKNRLNANYYHTFDAMLKPVLALRGVVGSIAGADTRTIPATERFYAGGASSIRGYGYQLAGPLDAQRDPLGGRSLVETSIEMRFRVKEDYGFVTFIDGGNAYDSAVPDFKGGMRFGAGAGLRYYTSFGPLRADIAVPLDKRPGVDDSYQLYFSIGQAF